MKTKLYIFNLTLLIIPLCFQSNAQSCNGIIRYKEDFGTGNTVPLSPGVTDYNYRESGFLNNNEYRLSKTTAGNSQWHVSNDHTGNQDGRMMIVNADDFNGSFYCDTVYGLTPATNYRVSLYAMNLNIPGECSGGSVQPRLQLIIEIYNNATASYARLSSYSTAFISETSNASWTKVEGGFQTPPNFTSVRFRLVNASSGGCGNDLAIDDLVVTECTARTLNSSSIPLVAKKKNALVEINWSVLQQNETDNFILQKSENGRDWQVAQTIKAKDHEKKYTIYDNYTGWNLYRIIQVDANGKTTYSNIARLNGAATTLYIYPNPFTSFVMLEWYANEQETITIRITDAKGQCHKKMDYTFKAGFNNIKITEFGSLPAGYYLAQFVDRYGKLIWSSELVKN